MAETRDVDGSGTTEPSGTAEPGGAVGCSSSRVQKRGKRHLAKAEERCAGASRRDVTPGSAELPRDWKEPAVKRRPRPRPIYDVHSFEEGTATMTMEELLVDLGRRERLLTALNRGAEGAGDATNEKLEEARHKHDAGGEPRAPGGTSTETPEAKSQGAEDGGVVNDDEGREEDVDEDEGDDEEEDEDDEGGLVVAPQVTIGSDGQIVINEESLTVTAGQEAEVTPQTQIEVDPNAYVNNMTYLKREVGKRWSREDTDTFYEGLRQFGTDFSLIQYVLPDRSRRQIKLKYLREVKETPQRVNNALTRRTPVKRAVLDVASKGNAPQSTGTRVP